jgi:hypothetical protein
MMPEKREIKMSTGKPSVEREKETNPKAVKEKKIRELFVSGV